MGHTLKDVTNKNIWIIGASSGIGEALARELHTEGANLILSARSEDKLKAINKDLGAKHTVIPLDASDANALKKAANSIGHIDSVIFMAAIYAAHSEKPHELDFVHNMLNVNIGGAFNTAASQDIAAFLTDSPTAPPKPPSIITQKA